MNNGMIYILLAYGLTNIIVYGSIFETPRTWLKSKSKWIEDVFLVLGRSYSGVDC